MGCRLLVFGLMLLQHHCVLPAYAAATHCLWMQMNSDPASKHAPPWHHSPTPMSEARNVRAPRLLCKVACKLRCEVRHGSSMLARQLHNTRAPRVLKLRRDAAQ